MVQRCTNPRNISYPRYGAIGVTVCEGWRRSSQAFLDNVGPRPSPRHSIDRVDGGKGYEPGNVRWATLQEQNRNRRQGLITVNGTTRHAWEWSEITGIPAERICHRVLRGMSPERAVSRAVKPWTKEDGGGQTNGQRGGKGEKNPQAKLNDDLVRQVRRMKAAGMRIVTIAKVLGFGETTIGDVLSGKRWGHVK